MTDDLDGVGRGVRLAEALVVHEPVRVGDYGLGLVEVGKQIQRARSAIPSVWPVLYPYKVFLDGSHKFFPKGTIHVLKGVEGECCRVVMISDVHCFESGGACQDDGRCSGIGRGHNPCCQEGRIDGGGEGEVKVPERAAANFFVNGRRVLVKELVHGVDCGVHQFAVHHWDLGVFEDLD